MNISHIKKIIYEEITSVLLDLEDPFMLTESVYYTLISEGDLQGEPLTPNELRDLLRKKVVNFEFIKLNGEQRPAKGTLRMDMIPQEKHPKGIRPSNKQKTVTYFDLDKDDWRSVSTKTKGVVLQDIDGKEASVIITDEPEDSQVKIEDTPKDDEVIITDEPKETNGDVIITEPTEEEPSEETVTDDSEAISSEDVDIETNDDGENTVKVNKELKKPLPKSELNVDSDGKGVYRIGKTVPNKKGYVKNGTYRNPIKIRINGKKDLDRIKQSKFGKDDKNIEKEVRLDNPKVNNPYETKPLTNQERSDSNIDSMDMLQKHNGELPTEDINDTSDEELQATKDSKFESISYKKLSNVSMLIEDMKNKINKLK